MNWRYLLRILVGSFWWPIISSISATNPSDSVNVLDSFDVANNLDIDEIIAARSNDKCGYYKSSLKDGDFGSIVTPNYPQNYPPRLECIWWLKSQIDTQITLTCHDVETQPCVPDMFDYLLISTDWTWQQYSIVCGENEEKLPIVVNSETNELSVFFRSSLRQSGRGVNCTYHVSASKPIVNGYNGEEICGQPNNSGDERIVGGVAAQPNEFPWIVGLSLNDTWFCGGSLISHNWILTAAHCLTGARFAHVLLGTHHLHSTNFNLRATRFVIHPNYNAESIENDIGLIELPQKIDYSDKIRPACLPVRNATEDDLTGKFMIAAGWGKTSDSSSISSVLNKLAVKVVSNENCKKSYGSIIHNSTICAIGIDRGTGTCQGDSGSALQYTSDIGRWIQVGVVSFGAAVGCVNQHPNGYSKIVNYLDWISSVTKIDFH